MPKRFLYEEDPRNASLYSLVNAGGFTSWTIDRTGNNQVGFANTVSVSAWAKTTSNSAGFSMLLNVKEDSGANAISLRRPSGNTFQVLLVGSNGTSVKDYRVAAWTIAAWVHIAVTWNGTTLLLYVNGVLAVPTKPTDDAVTLISSGGRVITFAGDSGALNWLGNIGHTAIWNSVLSAAAIASIHNPPSGLPFDADLRNSFGSYSAAGSLIQYWKPGWTVGDVVAPVVGLAFNSSTVDSTDIDEDAPA